MYIISLDTQYIMMAGRRPRDHDLRRPRWRDGADSLRVVVSEKRKKRVGVKFDPLVSSFV